jgi:hypothetical protein
MAETTVKELVPLIHHVPFVLVFIVAAIIAVRRREISSRRKKLLLTGLALLLLERVVAVWLHFADLTVTPPENAVIVARAHKYCHLPRLEPFGGGCHIPDHCGAVARGRTVAGRDA